MCESPAVVMNLSVLVFVITSVLAMGLSLTVKPIIDHAWELHGASAGYILSTIHPVDQGD